jgi:hypothetical protein
MPNNRNFPAGDLGARSHCHFALLLMRFIQDSLMHSVPPFLKRQCDRTLGNLTTGPNLPLDDLTAVMAGIYGSAPGSHGRCCQLDAPRHVSLLIVHTKYTEGRRLDDSTALG